MAAAATFTNTPGVAIREDTAIIHVSVTGVAFTSTYSWTSVEGGDITSDTVYTRPGGLQPGVQLGGPSSRSDVTVKRQYTSELDLFLEQLENASGAARMSVSWTPTDSDGNKNGATHTLTGFARTPRSSTSR
jgi:hypothetical protein